MKLRHRKRESVRNYECSRTAIDGWWWWWCCYVMYDVSLVHNEWEMVTEERERRTRERSVRWEWELFGVKRKGIFITLTRGRVVSWRQLPLHSIHHPRIPKRPYYPRIFGWPFKTDYTHHAHDLPNNWLCKWIKYFNILNLFFSVFFLYFF